ncbi:MAG: sulfurtransferase [Nitrospinota bacterium]
MQKGYKNPHLLSSPEGLWERLNDPKLHLIDARPPEEYAQGHIAGAVSFDPYGISLPDTRPGPLSSFTWMYEYLLGLKGVDHDRCVVIYEEEAGLRAARIFWFLEYFGHVDAHLLDGGLRAWQERGYPLVRDSRPPKRAHFKGERIEGRLATAEYLLERLGREDLAIVDARSDEEWSGKLVRARRAGAIPGAVHIEWKMNLDSRGALKPAGELERMYREAGITPDKEVIAYCQGGYRSAHTYLALRLLGYSRVRNYLGSWKEWGDREELPIVKP